MARSRKFKCTKCDRKFSMAAHLARHMSTMHTASRRKTGTTPRSSKLAESWPPAGHAVALEGIQAYHRQLVAQRDALAERIRVVEDFLGLLEEPGAAAPVPVAHAGGSKRPRGGSLKEYVNQVLHAGGGPMAVRDITQAVLKAGYKTTNKTFDKSVGIALAEMTKAGLATKVGRGVYRG